MAMLEGVDVLTLAKLSQATQAWVEYDYNRQRHAEIDDTPLARCLAGPDVTRPCPDAAVLRLAFTRSERRTLRKSDGTVTIEGSRFEVPNRYRHLASLEVRFASWDLTQVHLVDQHTATVLCRLIPQNKTGNASSLRRNLQPVTTEPIATAPPARGMAPLLARLIERQTATGLATRLPPQGRRRGRVNQKLLALYGLKWNPFAPGVPADALHLTARLESFCWRVLQLIGDGGFALVTGASGPGKSVALRILAAYLEAQRDVTVGVISRPQANIADFYREMGELFGVELRPHNRWGGAKVLRQRWQAHIDAALSRPVLVVDEAQEMQAAVLAELRLLSATDLDAHNLLTVVLAGDGRLAERLRSDQFLPLASRMRVRLAIERATPQELQDCLRHTLQQAGAPTLMTAELIATLCDHVQGNLRALMIMADELLAAAAHRGPPDRRDPVLRDLRRRHRGRGQSRGPPPAMTALPVEPAYRLTDRPEQQHWLVSGLWAEQAVGIIGGEPKCCKSFLALDLAVAVAAGAPCLRRFPVPRPGRVLLYPAEDALHIVRRRLDGICAASGHRLAELDVPVITAPSLRLDLDADRARLDDAVARLKPRLLVLDPFVRLHRIDENASGEVAPLLALLRDLQRRHAVAVAVVHHARKGASAMRAGQALRGSSEFHAWGDSNLYLRRDVEERIILTAEHRAAAAIPSITLALTQHADALALQPVEPHDQSVPGTAPSSIDERIAAALDGADRRGRLPSCAPAAASALPPSTPASLP